MKKLRISHTLLHLWEQNRVNEAIAFYLKKETPKTPQMELGIKVHKEIEEAVKRDGKIKVGNTSFVFTAPKVEHKVEAEYLDRFEIVGVYDVLDEPRLIDWKTGTTSSMDHAGGYQMPMYFFLAKLKGIRIDYAQLVHINGSVDITVVLNSPHQVERGKNYIDSLGYDIWEYFNKLNLLSAYLPSEHV